MSRIKYVEAMLGELHSALKKDRHKANLHTMLILGRQFGVQTFIEQKKYFSIIHNNHNVQSSLASQ